jgi:DNA-binding NarL/FixJ family response regulator
MKVMRNCILLVDDNAAVRRALRRVFEDAGWEVCGEADSGCDAILKAKQLQPQVILLDLAMPQMDGLVAGRILKQVLPEARLILFTLHGGLVPADELQRSGISALVSKSDPASRLLEVATRFLEPSVALNAA